jgi:hypothetical protein
MQYLPLSLALCLGLASASAWSNDTAKADKADKPAAEILIPEAGWSNGEFLGPRWWLKNPQNLKDASHLWLYHAELSYAFAQQGGNIDSTSHRGSADLYLRKGMLTSITSYDINKRDTTINLLENSTSMEESTFRQGFRYALRNNLAAVVGFLHERNTGKYLDQRQVWYTGVRYHALNTKNHDLMLNAFYAPQTDTAYISSGISALARYQTFPDVPDYSSNALYLAQRYEWQINDVITFMQNLDYMKFLDDSSFYVLKGDIKLDFKFNKQTSFFVSYAANYDVNSFNTALDSYLEKRRANGLPAGTIENLDTTLSVGIKFSF